MDVKYYNCSVGQTHGAQGDIILCNAYPGTLETN